jgi:hypothetical protein
MRSLSALLSKTRRIEIREPQMKLISGHVGIFPRGIRRLIDSKRSCADYQANSRRLETQKHFMGAGNGFLDRFLNPGGLIFFRL